MEIGEKYGQPDLKQFITGRAQLPAISQGVNPPDILHNSLVQYHGLFSGALQPICGYRNPNSGQHYGTTAVIGQQVHEIPGGQCGMVFPQRLDLCSSDSSSLSKCPLAVAGPGKSQIECAGGFEELEEGGDCGNGRWPRHETLTLLEIRSKMDTKFRETNQKGPLWDTVSRVMAEEHGYQRSGKKCREKFENLYKYYKKTKDGKAGRHDGKNYRFFYQLEALYGGETSNPVAETQANKNPRLGLKDPGVTGTNAYNAKKLCDSLTVVSGSSDSETSSSSYDPNKDSTKRGRRSWKSKIKAFVDSQMKKLMEKQEEWFDKVLQALEHKEEERILREEAWRKQETARFDREHKFWADERSWVGARDIAVMEAIHKLTEQQHHQQQPKVLSPADSTAGFPEPDHNGETHNTNSSKRWLETEILSLIKLRTGMETRFQESGSKGHLWEEIATKMGDSGHDRSAKRCKEKWENINKNVRKSRDCNKKRKENSKTCPYFPHLDSLYSAHENEEQMPETAGLQHSEDSSPSHSNAKMEQESCFRFLISEQTGAGKSLWDDYGLKINRE